MTLRPLFSELQERKTISEHMTTFEINQLPVNFDYHAPDGAWRVGS
jgi:hypothetical protein